MCWHTCLNSIFDRDVGQDYTFFHWWEVFYFFFYIFIFSHAESKQYADEREMQMLPKMSLPPLLVGINCGTVSPFRVDPISEEAISTGRTQVVAKIVSFVTMKVQQVHPFPLGCYNTLKQHYWDKDWETILQCSTQSPSLSLKVKRRFFFLLPYQVIIPQGLDNMTGTVIVSETDYVEYCSSDSVMSVWFEFERFL